jgi:hypothetical protein
MLMSVEKTSIEDRLTKAFEGVATTAERVGIPVATFALGAITIGISSRVQISILPWLGTGLILASLVTYVWLTSRSTIRVLSPPPPIPVDLKEQLEWMREELSRQNRWLRRELEPKTAKSADATTENTNS